MKLYNANSVGHSIAHTNESLVEDEDPVESILEEAAKDQADYDEDRDDD